jgi:hypothetical protein
VIDLAQDGSRECEGGGCEDARRSRELERPQEDVHPDRNRREQNGLGGDPGGAVGQYDEQPHQGIERSGVEICHERRAAEDVLVPEGQLAVTQHGSHQDMERVVLLQIVPGDQQAAADQIRKHEGGSRDGNQHDVGPQRSDVCS